MCGIVGYISQNDKPIDKHVFEKMTESLDHRGPDGSGIKYFFGSPFLSLGHKRLSIIDLTPAGHQPMSNEDGSIWIVYNGEIYNYQNIKFLLESRGHVFLSHTDTEVIIHAYEEWGTECVHKFNGMFAFALWDNNKKLLWLIRDRLGIKPLYYALIKEGLIFASEIKALLVSGLVDVAPDFVSLITPTRYQISPFTGFKNISKLPPAHELIYHNGNSSIRPYWSIDVSEDIYNESAAQEELEALLDDAVKLQMIADVPIGCFLSGGIDSSIITALMTKHTSQPINTFTIKFSDEDQRFEQMPRDDFYARQVSGLFYTNHKEFEIKPDITSLLPKLIYHLDEPLTDPAAINTYMISKAAQATGVTVLLNGMGGDEIFGGYRKQLACMLADDYQKCMPGFLRHWAAVMIENVPTATSKRAFKTVRWVKRFLSFASKPRYERYLTSDLSLRPDDFQQIYNKDIKYDQTYFYQYQKKYFNNKFSYLTQMCLNDTSVFLPEHNLLYSDKACMAASVEGRPPLTDHRIVEFMFKVAPSLRIKWFTQKYLLKKVSEKYLPRSIVYRPKAPFGAPLRSWIRRDLKGMVDDLLTPSNLKRRGLYNADYVAKIIKQDREGKEDHSILIWQLLTSEIWFRTFFDQPLEICSNSHRN
ncbi:MAG: asparagine synthase (glutamine-hydrolyzing) [Proteobacteria bacterium]|nr:asparagine synthase (glutamine-hydrolyzing) [Pseudomonadota bacterium]